MVDNVAGGELSVNFLNRYIHLIHKYHYVIHKVGNLINRFALVIASCAIITLSFDFCIFGRAHTGIETEHF